MLSETAEVERVYEADLPEAVSNPDPVSLGSWWQPAGRVWHPGCAHSAALGCCSPRPGAPGTQWSPHLCPAHGAVQISEGDTGLYCSHGQRPDAVGRLDLNAAQKIMTDC